MIPSSVTSIGNKVFYNTRLNSVTIGTGVLSIGNDAFNYDYSSNNRNPIKMIWLPNTPPSGYENMKALVHYVGNDKYIALKNIIVNPFLSSLFEVNGIIYVPISPSERTCNIIDYNSSFMFENLHIDNNITNKGVTMTIIGISPFAFYENTKLKTLLIDDSVIEMGESSFENCIYLSVAKIGNKIDMLDSSLFKGCSSIEEFVIPKNITNIKNYVFSDCSAFKKITFENSESELTLGTGFFKPILQIVH